MKFTLSVYVRDTIQLWLSCLIELLLFLPIWILVQVYLLPNQAGSIGLYILPLLSLGGVLLRYYCNVRWKQLVLALLLGVTFGMLSGSFSIASLPLGVAGCICLYFGMTADSRYNISKIYWAGIGGYFIATIFFHRIYELQPFITLLTWCGGLCLVLTLLVSNSKHLRYSFFSDESVPLPEGLQRHNRIYVIVILIAGLLLAAGAEKSIGLLVWNTLRLFFGWLSQLFSSPSEPTLQEVAPAPVAPGLMPTEGSEAGLLATILDIALYILGAVAIGFAIYFVLRWLYRNVGGKWRRAIDALLSMLRKERTAADNTGYLDEEKSVFTWEKTLRGLKDFWSIRLTPRVRSERWDQMIGERERVRWLYRKWLRMKRDKGYEVKSYLTPKETGQDVLEWAGNSKNQRKGDENTVVAPDRLIKLYDKVRYSEEEPSMAEVVALKEQLKL